MGNAGRNVPMCGKRASHALENQSFVTLAYAY